jgi:hypothetical protein
VYGNFSPKHNANESFVEIPKCCNPMNQTRFVGINHIDPNPAKVLLFF